MSKFTGGYYTYVCATDEFDLSAAESGKVPTLKYESDRTGYFMMPEGCTTLCWYFCGTDDENSTVTQTGKIADVKPLTLYTLKFAYSKDAGGNLVISATVDTTAEHREDNIAFNPDPVVKGDGFDVAAPYDYTNGERTYIITALDNISEMLLTTADASINLLSGTYAGIAVTQTSGKEYRVTFSYDFFNSLAGGTQEITFRIKDASGGIGVVPVTYGIQGVNAIASRTTTCGTTLPISRQRYSVRRQMPKSHIAKRAANGRSSRLRRQVRQIRSRLPQRDSLRARPTNTPSSSEVR